MAKHDPTLPDRLIALLNSGIPTGDRSLVRLAYLLGRSKGCVEYHIRNLRLSGEVIRDQQGVLQTVGTPRQMLLQLDFDADNVIDMSEARRLRIQLGQEAKSMCRVLVVMEVPSTLSAADIDAVAREHLRAQDIRVFGESTLDQERARCEAP